MSEAEIQQQKEKISQAHSKLEKLKEEVVAELQRVLNPYLDRKVNDVMRENHSLVADIQEAKLRQLKTDINNKIPIIVTDTISNLRQSNEWFKCHPNVSTFGEIHSSPMWKIVEAVDSQLLPILKRENLNVGERHSGGWHASSSIVPLNWDWLYEKAYTHPEESKLSQLDRQYSETLKEYCMNQDRLGNLEVEKKKRAASDRWKSL